MFFGALYSQLRITSDKTLRHAASCISPLSRNQTGNIFFALFGAVAIVGVLGAVTVSTMRGPLSTMVEVQSRAKAESEMAIGSRLSMLEAIEGVDDGNCDTDPYIEPLEFEPNGDVPSGGGLLPSTVASSRVDPWGTDYGYCAWDPGSETGNAGCNKNGTAGNQLLDGDGDSNGYTVIAIISAGPDQEFQTSCTAGPAAVNKGGDDIVVEFTYAEAAIATDGLWSLKSTDPDIATIDKNIEVGGNIDLSIGGAGTGKLVLGAASMLFPTEAQLPTCNLANDGLLRLNTSTTPDSLEICDDPTGWVSAGGSVWVSNSSDEIYFNSGGVTEVGIGTSTPNNTLDVVGTLDVSGAVTFGDTLGVTGTSTMAAVNAGATTVTTLGATGAVDFDSTLNVDGTSTMAAVNAGATTVTTLGATGAVDFDSTLNVDGTSTLADLSAEATNVTTLDASGAVDFASTLNVDGATTLGGAVDAQGTISNSTGNITIGDNVDVSGDYTSTSGDITLTGGTVEADNYTWNGDTLTPITCSSGEYSWWDGDEWLCGDDINGDADTGGSGGGGGLFQITDDVIVVKPSYATAGGDNYNEDFVIGSPQLDDDGDLNHHNRFFFNKSRGAFRAGSASDDTWDNGYLGSYSTAFGRDTTANGSYSTAFGRDTTANGNYSTAFGRSVIASGDVSTALGYKVVAGSGSPDLFVSYGLGRGHRTFAVGLQSASKVTDPRILGDRSAVFFFDGGVADANSGYDFTESDKFALIGGEFQIDDQSSTANKGCLAYDSATSKLLYSDDCTTYYSFTDDISGLWTELSATRIHFGTTGSEQVGIGTNNPLATLDVNGGIRVGTTSGGDTPNFMNLNDLGDVSAAAPSDGDCIQYNTVSGDWETGACAVTAVTGIGLDTEVIYNDSGTLAGDAGMTYNDATDSLTLAGDLTISGDDLIMSTNTSGHILVADGTNFNPVAMSGDATIASDGAITVADNAIEESMINATGAPTDEYCLTYEADTTNFEWVDCATAAGSGAALDDVTAADGSATIANGTNSIVWNWAQTGAGSAFTFGETTAASGGSSDQYILTTQTLATSTAIPLFVNNLGAGDSFRVDDASGDTSPFVITADGYIGVGTATPSGTVDIVDDTNTIRFNLSPNATADGNTAISIFTQRDTPGSNLNVADAQGWQMFVTHSNFATADLQNQMQFRYWDGTGWNTYFALDQQNGTIGISDTRPDALLEISASGLTTTPILMLSSDDDNDGDLLNISGNGNVGIGDFSADTVDTALHLQAGEIKLDGGMDNGAGCIQYDDTTDKLQFSHLCNGSWSDFGSVASGALALNDLSDAYTDYTTDYNMVIGDGAGAALTTGGIGNFFAGINTASNTTVGDYNLAIGRGALTSSVALSKNTAIGYQSMYYANDTTTPADGNNTALGYHSLRGSTTPADNTGTGNTAVGASSLGANTSGSDNFSGGLNAMLYNTEGNYNVAIGRGALADNTAQSQNTAIGYQSMVNANDSTTPGNGNNTALGFQAMYGSATAADNIGTNNLALGASAMDAYTSGSNNVVLGYQAGDAITSGSSNIIIGTGVDPDDGTADNQLNIGDLIKGTIGSGLVSIEGTGALTLPVGTDGQRPTGAAGMIRYNTTASGDAIEYYDLENTTWKTLGIAGAASSSALDDVTAADGSATIANGTNSIVWNWAQTGAGSAFTFGETTAASGGSSDQYILTATTLATSTAIPLYVDNNGAGLSFVVDDANGTAFTIDNDGDVSAGKDLAVTGNYTSATGNMTLTAGDVSAVDATLSGDLTIPDDGLFMATTNTSGHMLINDGTNFNPVAMSGDATIASDGAITVADNAIEESMINATGAPTDEYCLTYEADSTNFEWVDCATAADGSATIANGDNAILWNWATTTADADAFTFGETTASTATGTASILKATTLASSTATPLMVTNLGDGAAFRVNDETGDADTSPFIIDASGNVGIGTASPSLYGTTKALTVSSGSSATSSVEIQGNVSGSNGDVGGVLLYNGTANIANIVARRVGADNSGALYFATANAGTGAERMRITSTGYVGIGTDTPQAELHVVGDIQFSGTITDVSDMRLKENIVPMSDMLDRLAQIDTYSFTMKEDENHRVEFGVMAQELEKIFPELVHTAKDEMGTKSVNYMGLIAPMIKATKELKGENNALRTELSNIKTAQLQTQETLDNLSQQVALLNKVTSANNTNKASMNALIILLLGLFGGAGIMMLIVQRQR